jgi:hypothetical protein
MRRMFGLPSARTPVLAGEKQNGCRYDTIYACHRSSSICASWTGLADRREVRSGEDLADRDDLLPSSGRIPKCAMYLA